MNSILVLGLAALAALVPVLVAGLRHVTPGNGAYRLVLVLGAAGPLVLSAGMTGGVWRTGFGVSLWVTIAVTMVVFATLCLVRPKFWGLAPLLLPYLIVLGILATVWNTAGPVLVSDAPAAWVQVHIFASVLTYALLTLGAVAGAAVIVREHGVRTRSTGGLASTLPAIAEAERMQVALLISGEGVLGTGILSGMATQFFTNGAVLTFDHKVLLSLAAFVLIAGLLVAHYRSGVRGRRAARWVLVSYLLITLGFPGVKFVADVLIG